MRLYQSWCEMRRRRQWSLVASKPARAESGDFGQRAIVAKVCVVVVVIAAVVVVIRVVVTIIIITIIFTWMRCLGGPAGLRS